MSLYEAIANLFQLLQLILLVRILLTWFPNVNWYNQPFKFLRDVSDPILEPFRKIIPPIGGLDLSPMVLFFVLSILEKVVLGFVSI
ncbi:MAG: YggT family protein [bacterium]